MLVRRVILEIVKCNLTGHNKLFEKKSTTLRHVYFDVRCLRFKAFTWQDFTFGTLCMNGLTHLCW